ncbi:hypothetical protein FQN54_009934 [Arachnomyces sp. PD_36]|nr:hypothetical protein FQN54_009934 [Arachnomyces sp. PD_36]
MSDPRRTPSNNSRPQTYSHSRNQSCGASKSAAQRPVGGAGGAYGSEPFLQQRGELVGEISAVLEQCLQSVNTLTRSLEGVIAVGNEFSSVESLWSQFENVNVRDDGGGNGDGEAGTGGGDGGDAHGYDHRQEDRGREGGDGGEK